MPDFETFLGFCWALHCYKILLPYDGYIWCVVMEENYIISRWDACFGKLWTFQVSTHGNCLSTLGWVQNPTSLLAHGWMQSKLDCAWVVTQLKRVEFEALSYQNLSYWQFFFFFNDYFYNLNYFSSPIILLPFFWLSFSSPTNSDTVNQ